MQTKTIRTPISIASLIALIICLACIAQPAWADVRKADIIAGATVEERDLTVSECPSVGAEYAVLVDDEGTVYFDRNASDPAQIASITKVMTAIVAVENAPDDLFVAVSEAAATVGESSANLQEGDVLDFDTALKALLVPSGNDAAIALAEAVGSKMMLKNPSAGNDPVEVFVKAMNEKAKSLGCSDTVYENPHGLDDGEYAGNLHSTAADQALVARCALSFPRIREIVAGGSTTITVKRDGADVPIELETTDELLEMYDKAIGIKTGSTALAGPSFMGAAEQDGRKLYAIVLNATDEHQRFVDSENLFEWGYDHIVNLKLANSSESITMREDGVSREVPVIARASHKDWIDKTVAVTLKDPDASLTLFDLEGNVSQEIALDDATGNVKPGDKLGTITFKQRNKTIATQDLVACESVSAPNPIDAISIWWQRLLGGLDETNSKAKSEVYNVMPILDDNVVTKS